MQIGNVEIKNNIFLAPMAGVTDSSYRIIAREMGAGLVTTEMISAKGLYYKDENTKKLTTIDPRENPIALQIFGSDPKIMAIVTEKYINPRKDIDIIDINMGCPAPKIVKNGEGSALMKNPSLIRDILREMVKASNKPITLKIRMGWDHDNINGIEIGKIAEEEGVSALTIHGRTRDMFYSGVADWDYIKSVKENLSIPIIGNGDIFKPIDAIRMMEYTNCDGVAIGRGAMGNPWIFKGTNPSPEEKIDMAIRHLDLLCNMKGEYIGVKEMRKHISWYLKGLKNSNTIKNEINTINEKTKMVNTLLEYKLQLNQ
jgi:nifR3 family TIM-barrel protein